MAVTFIEELRERLAVEDSRPATDEDVIVPGDAIVGNAQVTRARHFLC